MRVRLRPLLLLRIELASVTLDKAQVELVEAGGKWNVSTLAGAAMPAKTAPRAVPGIPGATAAGGAMVSRISLTNTLVHVKRLGDKRGDFRIQDINATVAGVAAPTSIFAVRPARAGALRLRDIRASMGSVAATCPQGSFDLEARTSRRSADVVRRLARGLGSRQGQVQLSAPGR